MSWKDLGGTQESFVYILLDGGGIQFTYTCVCDGELFHGNGRRGLENE